MMSMKTKKVKSAARFGSRYGVRIRKRIIKVDSTVRIKHICPFCLKKAMKREAAGIWICRRCGKKTAGGAYAPTTAATKMMRQPQEVLKEV